MSTEDIATFHRDGILFPCPTLSADEVTSLLGEWDALARRHGGQLPAILKIKPHLLVPRLWDLVHDSRIVDAAAALLGPDLLCFGTSMISKAPGDRTHVTWHQDATHWGLQRPVAVTAWLALTPSTRANGCVLVVPGTHHAAVPHDHPMDPLNLLGRKEVARVDINPASTRAVELAPGEMSLHHPLVLHGSDANGSTVPRIGFAIRYIAADNGQATGLRGTATLVRGRDFHLYDLEQKPGGLMDRAAMLRHRHVLRAGRAIICH